MAEPPFVGTIFVDKDIIQNSDTSTFMALYYNGTKIESYYDRRDGGRLMSKPMFVFNAEFKNKKNRTKVRVNLEFSSVARAEAEAVFYAKAIGALPNVLLRDVSTITINAGTKPYGGGNNDILIHTGQTATYLADGILHETLFHEACHTSLDADLYADMNWIKAVKSDGEFISEYARDFPLREDVAESCLMYFGLKFRPERISKQTQKKIKTTMPARIRYFDKHVLFDNETFTESDGSKINYGVQKLACKNESILKSVDSGSEVTINIRNETNSTMRFDWLDFDGRRVRYFELEAGGAQFQTTVTGHLWLASDTNDQCHDIIVPTGGGGTWVLENRVNSMQLAKDFKILNKSVRIKIQSNLKALGLYKSTIDGLYGEGTSNALNAFIEEGFGIENIRSSISPDEIFNSILSLKF